MQIEVVNPGETLWEISRRYGVSIEEIIRVNELDRDASLVPGQALVIPTTAGVYIVQPGDTLWAIANRFGVSTQAIAQANQITNPALLYPGTRLVIPEGAKMTIVSNAYLQPSGTERDRTLVRETANLLSFVSIFQYIVTREGNLVPPQDQIALTAIQETNAAPMMTITNFEEGTFSAEITKAIFDDTAIQDRLITNILNVMRDKGFRALNVDFEHIYPTDRERYNAFLRKVTNQLHNAGYQVSTALAPKASATQVGQWYEAHDYPAHGQIVDFVVIMTYEWGWSGGPPMAVAPIPQVRQVLEYAMSVIPRNKIVMGAPLYGYDWTLPYVQGGPFARALSPQAAVNLARREGANIEYDYRSQAPFFRYYDDQRKEHVVWFEDARSMQAKFDLIKQYRLLGISYWVLGHRFPQNWALLGANFNIRKF